MRRPRPGARRSAAWSPSATKQISWLSGFSATGSPSARACSRTAALSRPPTGNIACGELRLRQREEEVRLVLRPDRRRASGGTRRSRPRRLDAGVMARSRRTRRRAPRRASTSVANFRSPLQCTHGIGVRPAAYSRTKFEMTVLVELPLEVDDVVGDADARRRRAARRAGRRSCSSVPKRTSPSLLIVSCIDRPITSWPCSRQQRRGDRGIDAAGHGDDDSHEFSPSASVSQRCGAFDRLAPSRSAASRRPGQRVRGRSPPPRRCCRRRG